jgi:hypothetical protein
MKMPVLCLLSASFFHLLSEFIYYILIYELGYANPYLASPSENKIATLCKE